MEELVFTPSAVLGLLSEIEELADAEISIDESEDGVTFIINGSEYNVPDRDAVAVEIDEESLEEVSEANEEGFAELDVDETEMEPVEGGIIKELAKTLMLGGLVRLTGKALKNM